MSTNDRLADKDSAADCTDNTTRLLPQHVHLGRDREGYRHHLDRAANVVWRFDDAGDIERVTPLGDAHLDAYLAFVADDVGWDDRRQLATWDIWGR